MKVVFSELAASYRSEPTSLKNSMKPIVLILTGHYLPGYKAGGILHNVANTLNSLGNELDFRIITRDSDLGDNDAYAGIAPPMNGGNPAMLWFTICHRII